MEINKDKKQKDCMKVYQKFIPKPFLCLEIKEDTDVEDEFELESADKTQKKKVQQTIKGRVFTTEIVYEQNIDDGVAMREESKITYVLPVGTRLIWIEGEGYTATNENFQTLEEIEEVMKLLK